MSCTMYSNEDFNQHLKENTNDITDNFCISGNYVSQLIQKEVKNAYCAPNTIDINYGGLFHKIQIMDISENEPRDEYDLIMIGRSVMNSKDGIFDFEQESNENPRLKSWMTVARGIEPDIPNREKFLNFRRMDTVGLRPKIEQNPNEESVLRVKLFGYFFEKNSWTEYKEKIVEIFLHEKHGNRLSIIEPVDSFDVCINGTSGTVKLYLDGVLTKTLEVNSFPHQRIKFHDLEKEYHNCINDLLTDNINKNTLNFASIDHIYVVTKGCFIRKICMYYYETCKHPSRSIVNFMDYERIIESKRSKN